MRNTARDVPDGSDEQADERPGAKYELPRRGAQSHGVSAGVVGVPIRRGVHHGRPRGRPDETGGGQREEAAVVRHVRYGHAAERVSDEAAKQRAGEHGRRPHVSVRFGHDPAGQHAAARAGRPERAPAHRTRGTGHLESSRET